MTARIEQSDFPMDFPRLMVARGSLAPTSFTILNDLPASTAITEKRCIGKTRSLPARTLIRLVGKSGTGTPLCSAEVSLLFIKK